MNYKSNNSIKPSFTEKILIKQFKDRKIFYVREVEFAQCINPLTGYNLRYDFYLPEYNILVEYDGKDYHASDDVKQRDIIKNDFAKDHDIKLIRISSIPDIYKWLETLTALILQEKRNRVVLKPLNISKEEVITVIHKPYKANKKRFHNKGNKFNRKANKN